LVICDEEFGFESEVDGNYSPLANNIAKDEAILNNLLE
jgi:hypothetical protein